MSIAKTGFVTSLVSYIAFLALEWMRPGFVSNFLSPHLFLLAGLIFGVWWVMEEQKRPTSPTPMGRITGIIGLVALSFLLAWFAWHEGRPFGDFRVIVALIALGLPSLIVYSLKNS